MTKTNEQIKEHCRKAIKRGMGNYFIIFGRLTYKELLDGLNEGRTLSPEIWCVIQKSLHTFDKMCLKIKETNASHNSINPLMS